MYVCIPFSSIVIYWKYHLRNVFNLLNKRFPFQSEIICSQSFYSILEITKQMQDIFLKCWN